MDFSALTRTSASQAADTTAVTKPADRTPVNKETFLQLLVAQIKNQNPLNPADGVQFLSQLAQFSELEQMMGIRGAITDLADQLKPSESTTDNNQKTGA